MEKRTLLGWIFDFAVFALFAFITIIGVRFLGGSELLAGGFGVVIGQFATKAKDKLTTPNEQTV